jgi:hypothetical protein
MNLKTISSYASELKPLLSRRAFAPARSRLLWLPVHWLVIAADVLVTATRKGVLSRNQHRLALLESGLAWALWGALALAIGPVSFLLAFGVPLLVGNAIIMSLILTNLWPE